MESMLGTNLEFLKVYKAIKRNEITQGVSTDK